MKILSFILLISLITYIVFWHVVPYYQTPDNLDKVEARKILDEQKNIYCNESYNKLSALINNEPITFEVIGKSGTEYQIEVQSDWLTKVDADLVVMVSIDNGYRSAYHPMTDTFLKKRTNECLLKW